MPRLLIITGSTRPGRVGPSISRWIADEATTHGGFEVEIADLVDINLPLFDEPHHPMLGQYEFEHTKRWSAIVASADAFVFVIPEYNHSINAATKNAIDYLHGEWKYKPAIVASYGGVSGGLRATQALKPVLATLKISHVADLPISLPVTPVENGVFGGNDLLRAGLTAALNEALLMTTALATRRQS